MTTGKWITDQMILPLIYDLFNLKCLYCFAKVTSLLTMIQSWFVLREQK